MLSDSAISESVKALHPSDAAMGTLFRPLYMAHADSSSSSEGNDRAWPQSFGYPRHSSSPPAVGPLVCYVDSGGLTR